MRINHPVNFAVGMGCLMCFALNVLNKRNGFDIAPMALLALLATLNLMFGFTD